MQLPPRRATVSYFRPCPHMQTSSHRGAGVFAARRRATETSLVSQPYALFQGLPANLLNGRQNTFVEKFFVGKAPTSLTHGVTPGVPRGVHHGIQASRSSLLEHSLSVFQELSQDRQGHRLASPHCNGLDFLRIPYSSYPAPSCLASVIVGIRKRC